MIKTLLYYLNILQWPLWVKLVFGFGLAVLIPAILVMVVAQSGFNDVNMQHIQQYVSENGAHQQEAISSALTQATSEMANFLQTSNLDMVRKILETNTNDVQQRAISIMLRNRLFGSNLYTLVRLLDVEGTVIAATNALDILPVGNDNSESQAYNEAQTSAQNGINALIVIQPSAILEVAFVVRNAENQVLGYLIGTLDTDRVVLNHFALNGNSYNAYTYMVSGGQDPVLFTLWNTRPATSAAVSNSPAVARALNGVTRSDIYEVGSNRDLQVVGYFAPIFDPLRPETPLFALVTEAQANLSFSQALNYLSGTRLFVLLIGAALVLTLLVLLFNQAIVPPLNQMRRAIQGMSRGEFDIPVEMIQRDDEVGSLALAFLDMRDQIHALVDDLESRVAARTRDINATQEVSRFAATQRDLQTLLDEVVNLVVKYFANIYHAQIFLLDNDQEFAVLRASTGEVGKMLLQRGHRLDVGGISVIGQVTQQGQVVVARDTASSQVHRRNEFLPDTRAELAIPLRIGERIIGAVDVQSKQRNAFTYDEILVLQTMADQIAVAIENARLYQESVRRFAEIERVNRDATRAMWQEYVHSQRRRTLVSQAGTPTNTDMSDLRQQAIREGRIIVGPLTNQNTVPIAVPIQLSGYMLGAVEWELPAEHLDNNKLQLAQELANRLAISLDNARLFEESQRAADRERLVNAIAAKLTPQTEINEILQTAVKEVGQALRAPQVSIQLHHTNGKSEQQ
ncbi:MAG TPA: GAF domain-containing protein [Phototrophicaceae bacterium]|nr:GAF domain-containing protein [Phototrophicaceae bacterium]